MSPPTTPSHEAQVPSSKPQAKETDSFYEALDENQREVVDKTMEHTQGEAEPRVGESLMCQSIKPFTPAHVERHRRSGHV
jgi:hypothetical protein